MENNVYEKTEKGEDLLRFIKLLELSLKTKDQKEKLRLEELIWLRHLGFEKKHKIEPIVLIEKAFTDRQEKDND